MAKITSELSIVEKKLKLLPQDFFRKFGCTGTCLKRHNNECIVFIKNGIYPDELICENRKVWLASLLPDYGKQPSHAEVMLDFTKSFGHLMHVKEYEFMDSLQRGRKKAESELAEAESEHDEDRAAKAKKSIAQIDNQIQTCFNRWSVVWKQSGHLENEKVRMETPKQIEVTRRTPSPTDIADFLDKAKQKAIDAGFREVN